MSALVLQNMCVGYSAGRRRHVVLNGVSGSVRRGELVALVGPNGAGKSTLLRSVAGLQPYFSGQVLLSGTPMSRLHRREVARVLAVVLTDRFQVDHLRVEDVVALGRHPHLDLTRRLHHRDREIIDEAFALVDAAGLRGRLFASLSDGQRQRVLIARALAQAPEVLLLDEPTSFLDPPSRIAVMGLLRRISRERGTAVVVCTHEIELATRYCDQLWIAGGVERWWSGAPEDLARFGTIEEPFATPGIDFSLDHMRFEESLAGAPTIHVDGDGLARILAEHCARRCALQPVARAEEATTGSIVCRDDGWELRRDGRTTIHSTCGGLAEDLMQTVPEAEGVRV